VADEDLRAAIEEQARAHVARDTARFASYMSSGALVELGRELAHARGIRPRRFEVTDVSAGDGGATSEVRYTGGGSYVLRERWERGDEGWKATGATCPRESIRRPWWRRLPILSRTEPVPDRQELA
jgi:hypothetical protein